MQTAQRETIPPQIEAPVPDDPCTSVHTESYMFRHKDVLGKCKNSLAKAEVDGTGEVEVGAG